VKEHRNAVEAIADALVDHDVLDSREVHAIAALHGVPITYSPRTMRALNAQAERDAQPVAAFDR
jgi:hypothetical protein